MNNVTTWDYEGYWNTVLGANRDAADVVSEFELTNSGLDEWLGTAESTAWAMGGRGGDLPEEWTGFHARALAELTAAVTAKRIARAAKHIDATDLGDGRWAHYADETSSWYVVDAVELESLCDYLDDEDPQISGDAHSHWCAGTDSEEMPKGWTPEESGGLSPADVARWIDGLSFVTPGECQGQIVEVSYACDADYIYARSYDRSDRTTAITVYEHPADAEEGDFEPWNCVPSKGDLVGSVDL